MPTYGDPDLKGLGRFVRQRREILGLTQRQLGVRVGWFQERVSVIEHGKYGMPTVPALLRLMVALDVSFGELLDAAGYPGVVPRDGHDSDNDPISRCTTLR